MSKIASFLLLSLILGVAAPLARGQAARYDIVIGNARIIDGTGNPWFRGSIAIKDGRIVKVGRFEKADGGSLFLDEISEIDPSVQVKILRALEERQIERVGGDTPVDVDTRLIAATNRDLKDMVDKGDFREDLFYRLYVVVITLPPLRDRQDDILLLLKHYLAVFNEENGKQIEGFTPAAYEMLSAYDWPGNIRELRNLFERTVLLENGPHRYAKKPAGERSVSMPI